MTREDAIYWIKNLAVLSTEKDMPQIEEALNMAIEALADRKTEPQPFDKPPKCLGCLYSDLDKAFHPCASCVDFGKYVGEVSGKDEPQIDCKECKYAWWNSEAKRYECQIEKCPYSQKTENSSEKPNNCEHITEDGVTCAKYPACDDCIDNHLNKVKGSERLVKGSERSSE